MMSVNPEPNNAAARTNEGEETTPVEERQRLVLHELAVTLQTLECLTHVLDDLVVLTDPAPVTSSVSKANGATSALTTPNPTSLQDRPPASTPSGDLPPASDSSSSSHSIAVKQERLLEELHKWKDHL